MKRQLIQFLIITSMLTTAQYNLAQQTAQEAPSVAVVSQAGQVISQKPPVPSPAAIPAMKETADVPAEIPAQQPEQASAIADAVVPAADLPPAQTQSTAIAQPTAIAPATPAQPTEMPGTAAVAQQKTPPVKGALPAVETTRAEHSPSKKTKAPFELQELEDVEEITEPKNTTVEENTNEETTDADSSEEERIEFQFENTDLKNVIEQVSKLFNVTFLTDDIINPVGPGGKSVREYKLSFRTNKPLSQTDAWNLFTSFLDMAGFTLIDAGPKMYRVIDVNKATTAPVPSYIGVDPSTLPDSDQIIRYVYFIENTNISSLQQVIQKIMSPTGVLIPLLDLKALIFIDKAYNIKVMMQIVKELDKVNMPQAMSVLKLRRAEAGDVEKLFKAITAGDENKTPFYPGPRKPSTSLYFPEGTRVIAETRTNSLIILGTPDAIEKIEEFVKRNVDKDPERPYSPLFHYDLKYADAKTIAEIMTSMVQFGQGTTEAAKMGGIRGGDKYFKPMKFIPDTATNRLIIRGDYQDYVAFKEIIEQLDRPQQQIAIEILILTVTLNDSRAIGSAIRKKEPSSWDSAIGTRATFQTTGFAGKGAILNDTTTPGGTQLLGNLIKLVQGLGSGNSILSLGFDAYGVWGVMRALEGLATTHLVANPFLVASNKQQATVSVGETRRLITATVTSAGDSQSSYGSDTAHLTVEITPQINSDGKIVLTLEVKIEDYNSATTSTTGEKNTKEVKTSAIVSDREVLALGGLIQNRISDAITKVPILGDIPILGWLFKNQSKVAEKQNLLILISAQIIDPETESSAQRFSQNRIDDYQGMLQGMQDGSQRHDPIHKWFFEAGEKSVEKRVENFIFKKPAKRKARMKDQKEILSMATQPVKTAVADAMGQPVSDTDSVTQTNMTDIKKQFFGSPAPRLDQQVATARPRKHRRKHVSLVQETSEDIGVAA